MSSGISTQYKPSEKAGKHTISAHAAGSSSPKAALVTRSLVGTEIPAAQVDTDCPASGGVAGAATARSCSPEETGQHRIMIRNTTRRVATNGVAGCGSASGLNERPLAATKSEAAATADGSKAGKMTEVASSRLPTRGGQSPVPTPPPGQQPTSVRHRARRFSDLLNSSSPDLFMAHSASPVSDPMVDHEERGAGFAISAFGARSKQSSSGREGSSALFDAPNMSSTLPQQNGVAAGGEEPAPLPSAVFARSLLVTLRSMLVMKKGSKSANTTVGTSSSALKASPFDKSCPVATITASSFDLDDDPFSTTSRPIHHSQDRKRGGDANIRESVDLQSSNALEESISALVIAELQGRVDIWRVHLSHRYDAFITALGSRPSGDAVNCPGMIHRPFNSYMVEANGLMTVYMSLLLEEYLEWIGECYMMAFALPTPEEWCGIRRGTQQPFTVQDVDCPIATDHQRMRLQRGSGSPVNHSKEPLVARRQQGQAFGSFTTSRSTKGCSVSRGHGVMSKVDCVFTPAFISTLRLRLLYYIATDMRYVLPISTTTHLRLTPGEEEKAAMEQRIQSTEGQQLSLLVHSETAVADRESAKWRPGFLANLSFKELWRFYREEEAFNYLNDSPVLFRQFYPFAGISWDRATLTLKGMLWLHEALNNVNLEMEEMWSTTVQEEERALGLDSWAELIGLRMDRTLVVCSVLRQMWVEARMWWDPYVQRLEANLLPEEITPIDSFLVAQLSVRSEDQIESHLGNPLSVGHRASAMAANPHHHNDGHLSPRMITPYHHRSSGSDVFQTRLRRPPNRPLPRDGWSGKMGEHHNGSSHAGEYDAMLANSQGGYGVFGSGYSTPCMSFGRQSLVDATRTALPSPAPDDLVMVLGASLATVDDVNYTLWPANSADAPLHYFSGVSASFFPKIFLSINSTSNITGRSFASPPFSVASGSAFSVSGLTNALRPPIFDASSDGFSPSSSRALSIPATGLCSPVSTTSSVRVDSAVIIASEMLMRSWIAFAEEQEHRFFRASVAMKVRIGALEQDLTNCFAFANAEISLTVSNRVRFAWDQLYIEKVLMLQRYFNIYEQTFFFEYATRSSIEYGEFCGLQLQQFQEGFQLSFSNRMSPCAHDAPAMVPHAPRHRLGKASQTRRNEKREHAAAPSDAPPPSLPFLFWGYASELPAPGSSTGFNDGLVVISSICKEMHMTTLRRHSRNTCGSTEWGNKRLTKLVPYELKYKCGDSYLGYYCTTPLSSENCEATPATDGNASFSNLSQQQRHGLGCYKSPHSGYTYVGGFHYGLPHGDGALLFHGDPTWALALMEADSDEDEESDGESKAFHPLPLEAANQLLLLAFGQWVYGELVNVHSYFTGAPLV